jgi:hypothetical protein
VWFQRAGEAGFDAIEILSREPMDEERLPLYPIYQDGALDALFALVAPEQRWRLVQTATIRAIKPLDANQCPTPPLVSATVCRL